MIGALVVYVVGIPFSYCVMLGVSPGAGFLHILVTAHDGLYTIAELFEVALVGPPPEATPSEDDDLFRGSKLPPPARSHSVFVTLILAVLLFPYGLFVFAVARHVYALSKATGFAHFMPTSTATDFASRLARQRGCCCGVFRRAALARIGRIGIWLPVPGMAGDPALTQAQREAQPQPHRPPRARELVRRAWRRRRCQGHQRRRAGGSACHREWRAHHRGDTTHPATGVTGHDHQHPAAAR